MTQANPYQPPEAKLVDESAQTGIVLAERGQRFAAAIVDGLLGLAIGVPIVFALGTIDYVRRGATPPFSLLLAGAVLGFAGFLLLHGYLLNKYGQTIGKRLLGIRIADLDNNLPPFGRIIGLRYLPIQALAMIPVLGSVLPLIDVLFIFREDRRCIHDLIAGTRVVKAA